MSETPKVWRISLQAIVRRAHEERTRLLRLHVGVAVLAIVVALLLPRWYRSGVTLVPAPHDGLSLDLTYAGAGLGGGMLGLGGGPTPQDQLRAIVRSRAVADSIVTHFGLREHWRLKRHGQARQRLSQLTTITTPREGEVLIEVEAESPVLARDLAAAYARYSGSESIRLKSSLALQRRLHLEARLAEVEREILIASGKVRRFEEEHGAVSLPDQAREAMDSYGALRAQRAMLQTELAAARRWYADTAPEVQSLRDRIAELDRQAQAMSAQGDVMQPSGQDLPALRQTYLQLTRDHQGLVAVAELMRRAREQARVEESNPVPAFSLLDAAELPERHARPQRGLIVVLALALCAFGSLARLWWTSTIEAIVQPVAVAPEPHRQEDAA